MLDSSSPPAPAERAADEAVEAAHPPPSPRSPPPTEPEPPAAMSARDKRLREIEANNAALEEQVAAVRTERAAVVEKLSVNPDETVKRHIKLLHDYNEIRDVGLAMIGMLAEHRQERLQDVMAEFGLKKDD